MLYTYLVFRISHFCLNYISHNLSITCSVCKFMSELVSVFVHLWCRLELIFQVEKFSTVYEQFPTVYIFPSFALIQSQAYLQFADRLLLIKQKIFDGLSQVRMVSFIDREWNECNALLQPNWNERSHSILKPKLLESKSQVSFICFTTVYPTITTWLLARLLFKTIIIIRISNYSMDHTVW